jgi:hypothetical protein
MTVEAERRAGRRAKRRPVRGHVLVTTLRNTAMPLIRYRIGDLAVRQEAPCGCGRGLPVFERLAGHANDLLVTAGGGDGPRAPEVRRRVAEVLDELVELPGATRVERVDEIPFSAAGKLHHVVSEASRATGAGRSPLVDRTAVSG